MLTPGYSREGLEAQIPVGSGHREAIEAIRQEREGFRSRVFPFVILPSVQPCCQWLLAIAFPSWAVVDAFVVFELMQVDQRLFVDTVPAVLDLPRILQLAKLNADADVEVFVDDSQVPLQAGVEVPMQTGVTLFFRQARRGRGDICALRRVLDHEGPHDPHPIVLAPPADRHFCIVAEEGHSLFSPEPTLPLPSPMVIPALLGFPIGSRICPALQGPRDVELSGYPCSAVLAIVDPEQVPSEPCVCLIDARGLLQGWMLTTFRDPGPQVAPLRYWLSTFTPPHWELYIEGAALEAGCLLCADGHVIYASFVPEGIHADTHGEEGEEADSEFATDDSLVDAESPMDVDTVDQNSTTSQRSRSPRRGQAEPVDNSATPDEAALFRYSARRCPASPSVSRPNGQWLTLGLLLHQVGPVGGTFGGGRASPLKRQHCGRGKDFPSGSVPKPAVDQPACTGPRPIPTPCRQRRVDQGRPPFFQDRHSILVDAARVIGPAMLPEAQGPRRNTGRSAAPQPDSTALFTLLEESLARWHSPAFFLASTLLDTLLEHHARCPVRVALSVLIPSEGSHPEGPYRDEANFWDARHVPVATPWCTTDLPAITACKPREHLYLGPLSLGVSFAQVRRLLQPRVGLAALGDIICHLPQRDVSDLRRLALQRGDPNNHCLLCLTDGSFYPSKDDSQDSLAWACLFVCSATGDVGAVSGAVPEHLLLPHDVASAFAAECCAIATAAWIGATHFHHRRLCIRSDCQAALGIFQGSCAGSQGGVVAVLKGMGSLCRAFGKFPPTAAYVPGHQGCLGNELADRLAKQAAKGHPVGISPWDSRPAPIWFENHCALLGWCGVALQSLQGSPSLPIGGADRLPACHDELGLEPMQLVAPFLPPAGAEEDSSCSAWGRLSLCVCSFNVLSLNSLRVEGPAEEGLAFKPARPAVLARSLQEAGAHVAFLQEARAEAGTLTSGGFLRFASGAEGGTLGTEVWVRDGFPAIRHPSDPEAHIRFTRDAFCVLHRDPRRLFLLFSRQPIKLLFISLHAPHRASPEEVIRNWWTETRHLVHRHGATATVVVGGDCNAAVGSNTSDLIGEHDAEKVDLSSDCFEGFLRDTDMWLPCTFPGYHTGPSGTYVQKRNHAN